MSSYSLENIIRYVTDCDVGRRWGRYVNPDLVSRKGTGTRVAKTYLHKLGYTLTRTFQ